MELNHNYFVYIVECSDGYYYTGVTNDIERRIIEHNNGIDSGCFTFKRRPVTLRYALRFQFIDQAIAFEKQVKGWNRKKKEALFDEDWNEIKNLAAVRQCKNRE